MTLHAQSMSRLCSAIKIDASHSEYNKFATAVTLLNQAYLTTALKEYEYILSQTPDKQINSAFDFLMALYNKHIREHQVMFLLFNIFETAIRAKAAVVLSEAYSSSGTDNWLHNTPPKKILHTLSKAGQIIAEDSGTITSMNTFEIFDYILLGGLKSLYLDFWSDLGGLFEEKTVHGHLLPKIGKRKMEQLLESIRKARNDNAHHKPFHKSRKRRHEIVEDIELILTHLNYNLYDAVNNIDPEHKIIRLKYA